MARKRKSGARKASTQAASKSTGGKFDRRKLLFGAGFLVLAIGSMASLHAYEKQKRKLHDLSVIGTGLPAIVQIHDPGCSVCRRLKSVTENTMGDLPDVNFRIADITTSKGREFQQQYGVPKTTLLLFDAKGKHLHTMSGLIKKQEITEAAERYFRPPS